jgi:hypothetical protein
VPTFNSQSCNNLCAVHKLIKRKLFLCTAIAIDVVGWFCGNFQRTRLVLKIMNIEIQYGIRTHIFIVKKNLLVLLLGLQFDQIALILTFRNHDRLKYILLLKASLRIPNIPIHQIYNLISKNSDKILPNDFPFSRPWISINNAILNKTVK